MTKRIPAATTPSERPKKVRRSPAFAGLRPSCVPVIMAPKRRRLPPPP